MIQKVDHSFGLSNYNYVMENISEQVVKDVYRSLGPFDHYEYKEDDETGMDSQREMQLDFDTRRSGA